MLHFSLFGNAGPGSACAAQVSPAPGQPSESGRIASIGDAAFSLEVVKGQERKTIEFLADGGTKVQGKLQVGAQATVAYRTAEGKNVAVHVVAPVSGLKAR